MPVTWKHENLLIRRRRIRIVCELWAKRTTLAFISYQNHQNLANTHVTWRNCRGKAHNSHSKVSGTAEALRLWRAACAPASRCGCVAAVPGCAASAVAAGGLRLWRAFGSRNWSLGVAPYVMPWARSPVRRISAGRVETLCSLHCRTVARD